MQRRRKLTAFAATCGSCADLPSRFGVHRSYSSVACKDCLALERITASTLLTWMLLSSSAASPPDSEPLRAISLSSFIRDMSRSSNCSERRYSAASRGKSSRLVWMRRASMPVSEFSPKSSAFAAIASLYVILPPDLWEVDPRCSALRQNKSIRVFARRSDL